MLKQDPQVGEIWITSDDIMYSPNWRGAEVKIIRKELNRYYIQVISGSPTIVGVKTDCSRLFLDKPKKIKWRSLLK